MLTCQNGWPVLQASDHRLHRWVVPARNGHFKITLRNGSAGFLLVHLLLRISELVEDVTGKVLDDWGWAIRPVRGQTTGYSNHAGGVAFDVNSLKHPLGRRRTWLRWQYLKLRALLLLYRGCIRLGIDYQYRPDEMHGEINAPMAKVERVARRLCKTTRGKRILAANPGQRKVIFS
jgi:hypothetical protein